MNLSVLISGYGCGCLTAANAATLFGPSLYFEAQDSPFYGGIVDNTGEGIFLENFEDGELNTPRVFEPDNVPIIGATVRTFISNPIQGRVNSVDGDDGMIDGQTFAGDTWTTLDPRTNGISGRMEFEFAPDEHGNLPRYVGIVITEALDVDVDVEVSWRDSEGRTLFNDGEFDPKSWSFPGASLADRHRFVGLFHSEGIERIQLDNVEQVDHLQYGFSIPEPSSAMMLLVCALSVFGFRKRRTS